MLKGNATIILFIFQIWGINVETSLCRFDVDLMTKNLARKFLLND
jgi:hypothetical protein